MENHLFVLMIKIILKLIKSLKIKNYNSYGIHKSSNFRISRPIQTRKWSKFDLIINLPGKKTFQLNNIKIPLIGLHNIRNATASIAVAIKFRYTN